MRRSRPVEIRLVSRDDGSSYYVCFGRAKPFDVLLFTSTAAVKSAANRWLNTDVWR